MKSVSGRQFCAVHERNGWNPLRVNGSHHIYGKQGTIARISVPVHGNKDLKSGLLRNIMKLAELREEDL